MEWKHLNEGNDGLCARDTCLEFAAVAAPDGTRLCWGHGVQAKLVELRTGLANFKQWEAELEQ